MTDLIVAVRAQLGPGHLLRCQPALFWPFPFSPRENNGRVCSDGWHLCGLRALLMSDKHIHNLIRVANYVMTLTISQKCHNSVSNTLQFVLTRSNVINHYHLHDNNRFCRFPFMTRWIFYCVILSLSILLQVMTKASLDICALRLVRT